ncbi:MAG: HAD family hydrolase, partial [Clostridia bacterium]|nr:HAD family hydrolase [Clostridia bacterium]
MKALLFDFDGTLVDSMPCWTEKVLNILRITNTPYPENIIELITPLGDKGTAEYFRNQLNVPLTYEEMFDLMDSYALPMYRDKIPLKESVAEFLNNMSEKYSLNVLTASPHKMLDPCLKRLGIYGAFDNVWSCDDFKTTKSDVNIYKKVAEKLGCKVKDI